MGELWDRGCRSQIIRDGRGEGGGGHPGRDRLGSRPVRVGEGPGKCPGDAGGSAPGAPERWEVVRVLGRACVDLVGFVPCGNRVGEWLRCVATEEAGAGAGGTDRHRFVGRGPGARDEDDASRGASADGVRGDGPEGHDQATREGIGTASRGRQGAPRVRRRCAEGAPVGYRVVWSFVLIGERVASRGLASFREMRSRRLGVFGRGDRGGMGSIRRREGGESARARRPGASSARRAGAGSSAAGEGDVVGESRERSRRRSGGRTGCIGCAGCGSAFSCFWGRLRSSARAIERNSNRHRPPDKGESRGGRDDS